MRAEEDFLPWDELKPLLDQLWTACQRLDCTKAREVLLRAVVGYSPTKEVEDLVWRQRNAGHARGARQQGDAARAAPGAARGSVPLGRPAAPTLCDSRPCAPAKACYAALRSHRAEST